VTCTDAQNSAYGVTANSFTSVSLDPPLLLWNIANSSKSLTAYLQAEHFAIHVLTREQQQLSSFFSKSEPGQFDQVPHTLSDNKVPVLADALARFECRTHAIHEAGDHHIIIGEICQISQSSGEPLLFYGGSYAELTHPARQS